MTTHESHGEAIIVMDLELEVVVMDHLSCENFTIANVGSGLCSFAVVTAYFKYLIGITAHLGFLDRILGKVEGPVLVGADVNAKYRL